MYDENVNTTYGLKHISTLDMNIDNNGEETYVRKDCADILV